MDAKAVIISESNRLDTPSTPATFPVNYRSLGAHIIKGDLAELGIESTVIDFCFHFDQDELVKGIVNYFSNTNTQYICISATLSQGLDSYYIDLAKNIKKELPNAKILFGGKRRIQRNEMTVFNDVDAIFLGRVKEMLKEYINGNDMSKFIANTEFPNIFVNNNLDYNLEKAVSYTLFKEDDFLTSTDVIGFEVALGCKFNCSFCNYPLRGSKNLYMNCEEQLYYTMQHAYDTYGITTFYASDDTVNESDEKLQLLVDVVKRLSFKPNIAGFFRLDVMAKRHHQIDMLKEAGVNSINFGIESFGKKAIKGTFKKSTLEDLEYVVKRLRTEIPDCWVSSGFIWGLANDDYDLFEKNLLYVENLKLVDNVGSIPLGINPFNYYKEEEEFIAWEEGAFSSLDLYPEKHGYSIDPITKRWSNTYTHSKEAFDKAEKYVKALHQRGKLTVHIEAFTWQSVISQNVASSRSDWYTQMNDLSGRGLVQKARFITNSNITKYMDSKLKWLYNEI